MATIADDGEEIMIVQCPNCSKQLKLTDRIRQNLEQLGAGKKIKVKCVQCGVPFSLDGSSLTQTEAGKQVKPPAPPDIEWLTEGTFDEQEVVEDIPRALVLMPESAHRVAVVQAATAFGYRVEQAASAQEAIEKMRFVNFAAVFLHDQFEPGGIEQGSFHQFMRGMTMARRRYIFYVLLGGQFRTLYDLQALACSANLVVNDTEIPHIGIVLKKAIPEYEALFGPLMEELQVVGK